MSDPIPAAGTKAKRPRGFAALTLEQRRRIAAMGGKAVPAEKRSFAKDPEAARRAGRVGGKGTAPEKRMFSRRPDLARKAGRIGGQNVHRKKAEAAE
jgi:general stress protein YciG